MLNSAEDVLTESPSAIAKEIDFIGLPALMTMAFNNSVDFIPTGTSLYERVKTNPGDANALLDMAIYLILRGEKKVALSMQAIALNTQQVFHYPRRVLPVKMRVLALLGPGDLMANSPFEFLLDDQPVALDLMYITPELGLPQSIPEHDVLLVAMSESEQNKPLLAKAATLLTGWPRPVINDPTRISELSRDGNCAQLANLPGVVMPTALRVTRASLELCCQADDLACTLASQLGGISYPVIIRPIDSHAGNGLSKIDNLGELSGYLQQSAEQQFFVAPFVDYRNADGLYRKYRIILIGGAPYVCHMAISQRWMVHYLNADMLENASHRAEEAQFMADFDQGFAVQHANAFAAIYQQLGLDYVGIDCAQSADGRLLIFEVDSNMVVHNMDSAEVFPYKKIQMPKLFRAFAHMLARRGGITL